LEHSGWYGCRPGFPMLVSYLTTCSDSVHICISSVLLPSTRLFESCSHFNPFSSSSVHYCEV
jgi:hypothetical protein